MQKAAVLADHSPQSGTRGDVRSWHGTVPLPGDRRDHLPVEEVIRQTRSYVTSAFFGGAWHLLCGGVLCDAAVITGPSVALGSVGWEGKRDFRSPKW